MAKNRYTIEVMIGFTQETENGYKEPETLYIRNIGKYALAKSLYRAIKKETKNAVHFYRNGELITFKGEQKQ